MAPEPSGQLTVDPQILRTMVLHLDSATDALRNVRPDPDVDEAGDALAGSAVDSACEGGALRVMTALAVVVSRLDHISSAARGVGDSFEVTDQSFADAMNAMGEL